MKRRTGYILPTLRTCFDTFWYFYDKPVSRKDSHRIGEIWSCELRFYFPLVFFLVHLKLLTQCRDHAGLRNKYRNRKSEVRSIGSYTASRWKKDRIEAFTNVYENYRTFYFVRNTLTHPLDGYLAVFDNVTLPAPYSTGYRPAGQNLTFSVREM